MVKIISPNRKKPVSEDLIVLNIKPSSFSEEFERARDSLGLMHIKGCQRDVLISNDAAIRIDPQLTQRDVVVHSGADGYAFLLTYITGLLSRIRGESQIVSQFKRAYSELDARSPESAKNLGRLFRSIIHDNGIVRNHVTRNLKPAFYEACAHELSEEHGKETVLVVANTNRNGDKPDELTENIIRYLGNNRKNAAKKIIFTHPEESSLRSIYSYFLRQKSKGRISSQIDMLPFNRAFDCTSELQFIQKVYVCYSMGQDCTVDKTIIAEWGQKESLGGKLIHLGGNSKDDRKSIGLWQDPGLFYYVSPEEILEWQRTRQSQNEHTIEKGKVACVICADIRNENQRPNREKVMLKLQGLS